MPALRRSVSQSPRFRHGGAGAGGGVAAADYVEVAVQHSAAQFSGVAQPRLEAEVGAECLEGEPGGEQLDIGRGDQLQLGVDGHEGVAVGGHGQQADSGRRQRIAAADFVDHFAQRGRNVSSRAPSGKKKRDCGKNHRSFHLTASFTAALSFS